MTVKYKSERLEVVHKTAQGLFDSGLITKERMKKFDDICLVKEEKQMPKQMRQERATTKQTQLEQTA